MKYVLFFVSTLLIISCVTIQKDELTAQEIVDKAIVVSGGKNYNNSNISFDFREMTYSSTWELGKNYLKRRQVLDSTIVLDVLHSSSLKRYVNDSLVQLHDTIARKYANSVNSVHYFARLPYGLNDQAVKKELLGTVELKKGSYYKIKVTFTKENGGEDFEDIFLYWINTETFKPDFLAYEYHTEGGGQRFRKAFNERYLGGIRFVDYINLKPKTQAQDFIKIDSLFANNALDRLSEIKLQNISVFERDNGKSTK